MSGQVLELEAKQKPTKHQLLTQASRLQTDALKWGLRALKHAKDLHMKLEQNKEDFFPIRVDNERLLNTLCDHVRSLCPDVAPTSLEELVEQTPQIESRLSSIKLPRCPSDRTIKVIIESCSLHRIEYELLRWKAAWGVNNLLPMVFGKYFSEITLSDFFELMSAVLKTDKQELRSALNPDGFLARSRIMRLKHGGGSRLHSNVEDCLQMRNGILQLFETANGDFGRLVRTMASPSPKEGLGAHDFSYLDKEWELATGYLKGSLEGSCLGANILLQGPPGLGKTEFARAVARAVGALGYEVKSSTLNHELISPHERRERYLLAGELLPKNNNTVLIFDDADGSLGWEAHSAVRVPWSKAALNQMLENNPFPAIWLMNDTSDIDPALMRRFDVNIPFRRPPSAIIKQLLKKSLPSSSVTSEWIGQVAEATGVTPAVVKRLGRLTERLDKQDKTQGLLSISLEMSGIKLVASGSNEFKRRYCNAEPGIEVICEFLESSKSSRLMLHGPTGTGKTALAKHLAQSTHLSPKLIRPSDILGMFVGETEGNIARLFLETDPTCQLIILDEFESLAQDRRGSHHNWEVSKVAELLGQFDDYAGRVIACTNLPENVDTAIRRRFHLKAQVGGLNQKQRVEVVTEFATQLNCDLPEDIGSFTDELDGLAYGHLVNAAEVARYSASLDWDRFRRLIRAELGSTEGGVRRGIGFVTGGYNE